MKKIPLTVSNRHIHLSLDDFIVLFGADEELVSVRELIQPGAFAAQQQVSITCGTGTISYVRVVGPLRDETQCELLVSDSRALGLASIPVRESGSLVGTPGFKIDGPKGHVIKKRGLIIAKRHIHLETFSAKSMGLTSGQLISIESGDTTINDVLVRVSGNYRDECHIDKDEAKNFGLEKGGVIDRIRVC